MQEIWKKITIGKFYNDYFISNLGRVKNCKGLIMKQEMSKEGYYRLLLYLGNVEGSKYKWHSIHRLVAHEFIGKCPEGLVVNHKDGVKTNNLVENLEYVTTRDNNIHAFHTGLNDSKRISDGIEKRGIKHKDAKLNDEIVRNIIKLLNKGMSVADILDKLNLRDVVARQTIQAIQYGRTWKHIPRN